MLKLAIHGLARPRPPPPLLRAAPVRREPLKPAPSPPTLSPSGRPTPSSAIGDQPGGATTADLEAFMADLVARRTASTAATYHKVLKILYGW